MVWVYAREVLLAAVSGFFHFVEEVFHVKILCPCVWFIYLFITFI
jgi:hypothetical protein